MVFASINICVLKVMSHEMLQVQAERKDAPRGNSTSVEWMDPGSGCPCSEAQEPGTVAMCWHVRLTLSKNMEGIF
jgi:hypothetical protein